MLRNPFRTPLIVATIITLAAGGCKAWMSIVGQRVRDSEVQRFILESLPLGTSKSDVEKWLEGRYEHQSEFQNGMGGSVIQCWITDSGARFSLIPDDIRIRLSFGSDNRLETVMARAEPRF